MQENGNTDRLMIKDGRLGPYGMVLRNDVATDSFRELTGAAVRVYVVLLTFANPEGVAYPSQRRLACTCGLARKTVCLAISELCDAGFVRKEPRSDQQLEYVITRPPDHGE